jgi:hypothetical protein
LESEEDNFKAKGEIKYKDKGHKTKAKAVQLSENSEKLRG